MYIIFIKSFVVSGRKYSFCHSLSTLVRPRHDRQQNAQEFSLWMQLAWRKLIVEYRETDLSTWTADLWLDVCHEPSVGLGWPKFEFPLATLSLGAFKNPHTFVSHWSSGAADENRNCPKLSDSAVQDLPYDIPLSCCFELDSQVFSIR